MHLFSGARLKLSKVVKTFVFSCCLLLSSFAVPEMAYAASQAQLEGELQVIHWDNRDHTSVTKHYLTTANGKRYELKFPSKAPHHLLTGTKLRVKGTLSGNVLALSSGTTGTQVLAAAPTYTTGVQNTAVILVNFQDNATQPIAAAAAQSLVFNTVSSFYQENSFQQTSFNGAVYGYYTIPLSSTVCDYTTLQTEANSAATAAGVNLSSYNRVVYMFPQNACGWSGLGTVGGSPSTAWINGSFDLYTVGHELGHNLGLDHAHGLACGANVIGSSCTNVEYGDMADIMGSTASHLNAVQKEELGWLNTIGLPPITTVQSNGTYNIDPYETNTNNPKALKILKSTDPTTGAKTWYYVEFRQAIGQDTGLSAWGNLTSGVLVHTGTDGNLNGSNLLDMTPDATTASIGNFVDAALVAGQTFTDSTAGVTITPVSIGSTGASISVSFAASACSHASPSVVVSTQSGSVAPGTAVSYTVAVTNNDSAGCSASTFNLQGTVPTGWTSALGSTSLSIAAGSASSTTMTATSLSTATAGSYSVSTKAISAANTAYTGSGSATYSVASSSGSTTTSTLGTTVSTSQASYSLGSTATITAKVTSGGVAVANASVTFTVTLPNGSVATQTATTGSTGIATYQMKLAKAKSAAGTYQVKDVSSSSGQTASATTSFSVH